ncbi:MAG: hypothetical protein IJK86_01700, partial [Lachnospiraceae bacterium]|nr:hypothetical protein [Lachnospiraceae bacterium]
MNRQGPGIKKSWQGSIAVQNAAEAKKGGMLRPFSGLFPRQRDTALLLRKNPPPELWCATRQEDSEKSKSSVPPVVYTAGGILMLPDSTVHGTQLVSSAADS